MRFTRGVGVGFWFVVTRDEVQDWECGVGGVGGLGFVGGGGGGGVV